MKMRVKYIDNYDTVMLEHGKVYSVISVERGWFRILTEIDEDYLMPPEAFETVLDTPPLFSDVKYICLDKEKSKYEQLTAGACIFFCSKHVDDADRETAMQLISNGCREFHFIGEFAGEWENLFDEAAVLEILEESPSDVVMTIAYDPMDGEYTDDIAATLCSYSPERKVFIFYYNADSAVCYESIGQIFRYLIDNTRDE